MKTEADEGEMRYTDFGAWGFSLAKELRGWIGNNYALHDGKARWMLPGPEHRIGAETPDGFIEVAVRFSSEDPTTELSWTASSAYIMALYQGACEGIRRSARRDGPRRFIPLGSTSSAEATIVGMTVTVAVSVLDMTEDEWRDGKRNA